MPASTSQDARQTAAEYLDGILSQLEPEHCCASLRASCAPYLSEADPFDVADALYWYGGDCHSGQWSREYALLCVVGRDYTPGRCASAPEPGSIGEMIYKDLCAAAGCPVEPID